MKNATMNFPFHILLYSPDSYLINQGPVKTEPRCVLKCFDKPESAYVRQLISDTAYFREVLYYNVKIRIPTSMTAIPIIRRLLIFSFKRITPKMGIKM